MYKATFYVHEKRVFAAFWKQHGKKPHGEKAICKHFSPRHSHTFALCDCFITNAE